MNFDEVTIDDIVVSLLMKGFLEYQDGSNGGIRTSLEPLNKILYRELELSILGNGLKEDKILSEQITKLYKKFEKDFSRSLAPVEIQKIDEWISVDKYSIDEIEFALKEAKLNNALSIKYIDKVLFTNKKRQDIEKKINGD